AQGGSVARAILENNHFALRALTRDVTGKKAQVFQDLGAEVVRCDLDDPASVEEALKGVYGAFVVTNFWDHHSKEKEACQGKLVADVAKRLGLKHVVYSGLENVDRLTGGKLKVLHFDGKGEVEEYFWSIGVPMTSVRLAAYFENFLTLWKPVKTSEGHYTLVDTLVFLALWVLFRGPLNCPRLPHGSHTHKGQDRTRSGKHTALPMGDVPMDGISVADVGAVVSSIFASPEEFVGKAVGLSAEALTIQQYADILSKTLGKDIRDAKDGTFSVFGSIYDKPELKQPSNYLAPSETQSICQGLNLKDVLFLLPFTEEQTEALWAAWQNLGSDLCSVALELAYVTMLEVD
ncbi:nmrA-like family domain-containing protein 1, partial [Cricetulus griseus]